MGHADENMRKHAYVDVAGKRWLDIARVKITSHVVFFKRRVVSVGSDFTRGTFDRRFSKHRQDNHSEVLHAAILEGLCFPMLRHLNLECLWRAESVLQPTPNKKSSWPCELYKYAVLHTHKP